MKKYEDGKGMNTVLDLVGVGYNDTQDATEKYDLHCHNFYEIYYFLEGEASYLVEGQKYELTPCSMLLLAPGVFHGVWIRSDKHYRRYAMHFHPDILSVERRKLLLSVFPSSRKSPRQKVYFEHMETFQIEALFRTLCEYKEYPEKIRSHLLPVGVEALLGRIYSIQEKESVLPEQHMDNDFIMGILIYLNRNLEQNITLDLLSEEFQVSKQYLNRAFRKGVGTTIIDYLLQKRIMYAQQLLINGCSATEAAERAGFQDYSSFYRSYKKKLGHSPLDDRGILPSVKGMYMHHTQVDVKIK